MGNLDCRGFPRGWLSPSGTFSCGCPKGLLGSPYSQHGTLWQARGGPQCLETTRAGDNQALRAVPSTVGNFFKKNIFERPAARSFQTVQDFRNVPGQAVVNLAQRRPLKPNCAKKKFNSFGTTSDSNDAPLLIRCGSSPSRYHTASSRYF